jgi:hypothetical protein
MGEGVGKMKEIGEGVDEGVGGEEGQGEQHWGSGHVQ